MGLRPRPGPIVIPDTAMAGVLVSVAPASCDPAAVGGASVGLVDHTKVTAVEAPRYVARPKPLGLVSGLGL